MAGDARTSTRALEFQVELEQAPHRYELFAALRMLECLHPDHPRVGEANRAADEAVRLGQVPSLAFAPSDLSSFERGKGGRLPRLRVLSFGLFGPNGPLPHHLTEFARSRAANEKDTTFSGFADIFHHRMLSLFYRAWAQAQPTVSYDRAESDRFGDYLASLIGLGMPELRNRDAVPDLAKLFFCGRLASQVKNADGLRDLVSGYFEVPAGIREFEGFWLEVPEENQFRLGESIETGCLGVSTTLGRYVWDTQSKFQVALGPMGIEDYRRFLPGCPDLTRLTDFVRNYVGDELIWELRLILSRKAMTSLRLGSEQQLGLTTWLVVGAANSDGDDLVFDPFRAKEWRENPISEAA